MNYFVEKCKAEIPSSFSQIFPTKIFQHFCDTARALVIIFDKSCSFSLYIFQRLGVSDFMRIPYCGGIFND